MKPFPRGYAYPVKHDRIKTPLWFNPKRRQPITPRPSQMTICIAAIYRHIYGIDEITKKVTDAGPAIITASDRMLTVENLGIEYEPFAYKYCHVAKRIMILIADNVTVHSQLLLQCQPEIFPRTDSIAVVEVAELYARSLREFKAKQAEQFALSLYGLTTEAFIEKQKIMHESIVMQLANQMQEEESRIKAEALVCGVDEDKTAHIFYVDNHGLVHCYDDVGFATIGMGNNHANHQFMRHGYANTFGYYQALMLTYSAKKEAEIAPSVGKATDMRQITRDGAWNVLDLTMKSLDKCYSEYDRARTRMEARTLEKLMKADKENIERAQRQRDSGNPTSA